MDTSTSKAIADVLGSAPWLRIFCIILLIPASGLVLFSWWIRAQKTLTFEDKAKAWEVFIGAMSTVITLAGGALFIGQYFAEQKKLEAERAGQAQRELESKNAEIVEQKIIRLGQRRDQKAGLYNQITMTAVDLAELEEGDLPALRSGPARQQFERMYWAQLIGVEGREVEGAMVGFRRLLDEWERTGKKPGGNIADEGSILDAAYTLSKKCKAETEAIQEQIEQLQK